MILTGINDALAADDDHCAAFGMDNVDPAGGLLMRILIVRVVFKQNWLIAHILLFIF